jgi:hypothetical protein
LRLAAPSFHPHPLTAHYKSAHRGGADVRVGRGNHEAFGEQLTPLRGWYPIEILHFPVRSLEHCRRKYVTQFVALGKNAEKGIAGHMSDAYRAYLDGDLDGFYAPLVIDDAQLQEGLAAGTHAIDTRLRDRLRALGFGETAAAPKPVFGQRGVRESAEYAAEYSVLNEADIGVAFGSRVAEIESRISALERRTLPGVRATLAGRRA